MGTITIADSTSSWSGQADEFAEPIWNSNTNITIGGIPKSQADSQRLKITLNIVCKQSELQTLSVILKRFTETLTYTPSRALYDRTTVDPITVVVATSPKPRIMGRDGELLYFLDLELEEVLTDA
jgi:hypothetical protein